MNFLRGLSRSQGRTSCSQNRKNPSKVGAVTHLGKKDVLRSTTHLQAKGTGPQCLQIFGFFLCPKFGVMTKPGDGKLSVRRNPKIGRFRGLPLQIFHAATLFKPFCVKLCSKPFQMWSLSVKWCDDRQESPNNLGPCETHIKLSFL